VPTESAPLTPTAERDGRVALPDGRTLSYAELGDPSGVPVVVLDGPGSRGLARAASAAAATVGVRLIAPDRPGFGDSTPDPSRTFASWPADLAALADHLGIARFGLLAQSGGTPYALATALRLPERVRALGFTGAISPLGEPDAMQDVAGPMRVSFALARRAPWLLRPLLSLAARDPDKAAERAMKDLPPLDRAVIEQPAGRDIHVRTTREILAHTDEMRHELRLLVRPWDLDLADVRVPVRLWVGACDPTHPPVMSERLVARLPDARMHVVPDAATFGLVGVYGAVLRFCADA
jgi:pimeloyl-ACP methyl ester carboxylesterase